MLTSVNIANVTIPVLTLWGLFLVPARKDLISMETQDLVTVS